LAAKAGSLGEAAGYGGQARERKTAVIRGSGVGGDLEDEGDSTLYYCADGNGNVTALTDTSGAAVERYVYDPYGKPTIYNDDWTATVSWANSKQNEILYCGYRFDPESGLYHVRNRMYDYDLGRWLQRDPKGYVDGMGLYEYVGGCPLSRLDAMGLEEKSLWGVIKDAFNSMWGGSNETPTERRQRLGREFNEAAPEPVFVTIVRPDASKVEQMQAAIRPVAVAGPLVNAGYDFKQGNNSAAWGHVAEAAVDAGTAFWGAAGALNMEKKVLAQELAARVTAGSKVTATGAAPVEAAEVQAATKTVSTPKSPADMPVDLRGPTPTKPTSTPEAPPVTGTRYVGPEEAQRIKETGLVPNTNKLGQAKDVFYTPEEAMQSANEAQKAYRLPEKPTHAATVDTTKAKPDYAGNVEGTRNIEATTRTKMPVTEVKELKQ